MYVNRIDGDAWIEEYRTVDISPPQDAFLVMGRLGGDEFVLSAAHDTEQEAKESMIRLRLWALARMTG